MRRNWWQVLASDRFQFEKTKVGRCVQELESARLRGPCSRRSSFLFLESFVPPNVIVWVLFCFCKRRKDKEHRREPRCVLVQAGSGPERVTFLSSSSTTETLTPFFSLSTSLD